MHALAPANPLLTAVSPSLTYGCACLSFQGIKAVLEGDMFLAEAFEARKGSAFEHLGEVGRVLRRYAQQPDLTTLQLSHCIRSIDQV